MMSMKDFIDNQTFLFVIRPQRTTEVSPGRVMRRNRAAVFQGMHTATVLVRGTFSRKNCLLDINRAIHALPHFLHFC